MWRLQVSTPIIFDKIIKQTNKQKSGRDFCTTGNKGCRILLEIWLSYTYSFFKLNDCKISADKVENIPKLLQVYCYQLCGVL